MGWESSDVDKFDLGPVFQGQTMVHWLWCVVFQMNKKLYQFSDA